MSSTKAIGIDPGTGSFDVCGIEDGEVFYEDILDSESLAKDPDLLLDSIEKAKPLDLIVGPSGYGVELTYLRDLDFETLEDWYLTYILLLKREDLESALEENNPGIMVYSAMTESAEKMKKRDLPVCYIPGVINLPTVPEHRKINNLDMGTVDKLCSGILGIHEQSRKHDIPYSDVSFILVEMGAGYNATLAVDGGKIVDGVGGTMGGIGFLCAGELDLEMAQLGGDWEKSDVFTGGVAEITGEESHKSFIEKKDEREDYGVAWKAMMEGIEKSVYSISTSVSEPREILISGRLTESDEVREELSRRLDDIAPVSKMNLLKGAKETKEAAQGYGMVAEGLAGGKFSDLVECTKIREAKGTALDYLYHPKGRQSEKELREKVPFRP